jgi:hypothetical protein
MPFLASLVASWFFRFYLHMVWGMMNALGFLSSQSAIFIMSGTALSLASTANLILWMALPLVPHLHQTLC